MPLKRIMKLAETQIPQIFGSTRTGIRYFKDLPKGGNIPIMEFLEKKGYFKEEDKITICHLDWKGMNGGWGQPLIPKKRAS